MRNCSPHAPASNPTDTKLSQHAHKCPFQPVLPEQGELCTAPSAKPGTKLSQHTHTSSPTGTKLSQHAQNCPFQPVLPEQGELCTASTTTPPSRENFVPLAPPRSRAGRTLYRSHHHDPQQGELCTAPCAKPGTKLSQHTHKCPFQPVLPEQGELCTAATTKKPSRENFVPRPVPSPVQNSPRTPTPAAQPVQNSPNTPTPAAQPVQNSPNTPKKAHFSQFCTSRENFVPHPPPRPPAGRTLYRAQCQTRYKTLPAPRSTAVPRKSSPSTPKNGVFRLFRACRANFFAHKQATSHAGRIISRTGDRTGSADEGRMR